MFRSVSNISIDIDENNIHGASGKQQLRNSAFFIQTQQFSHSPRHFSTKKSTQHHHERFMQLANPVNNS
jgi:hypothetical protein